jgi:hypothetical protein
MSLFDQAVAALEEVHKQDPNMEREQATRVPAEWLYTKRIAYFLQKVYPDASEELKLAGYCQHLYRWEIKRDDYPKGKAGYYQWRNFLGNYQAEKGAAILRSCGYSGDFIDRVVAILKKVNIRRMEEAQKLEDVVCLVFLQYYMEPFAAGKPDDQLIQIVQKTWTKMSEKGRAEALSLNLPSKAREIVNKALNLMD